MMHLQRNEGYKNRLTTRRYRKFTIIKNNTCVIPYRFLERYTRVQFIR